MMIPSQSYSFSGIVVTLFFYFLFFFVLHILASPKLPRCRHDQRDVLLEIQNEFPRTIMYNSSNYYYNTSAWDKSSDCCSWGAVMCDANGQVISLDLRYSGLNNTLKPNSGRFKLQYLQNLTLLGCNLYGEIPSSFEKLSHLTMLELSSNEFVGQIPAAFGNLSHLIMLDLSYNALVGQVPPSIGNLTKLRHLDLRQNKLFGKIPFSVANLTKLVTLDLSGNYFEPQLLPDISRFHNLEEFSVSGNSFFGHFPTSLFTIPSLGWVNLAQNQFKGPIDFGNLSSSSQLWILDLADNKFDGPVPESISKFINLEYLDLSNNKLEGKVPGYLWRLASLQLSHNSFSSFEKSSQVLDQSQMLELRLDSNSFRGPFLHGISKLRSVEILDLSNNSFNGSIPPCLRNFTDSIKVLNLGNNNFSGILPDLFVNTPQLSVLDVSDNRLEGKLPKSLISCKEMTLLNVGGNKFKDKFPSWLGSVQWLKVLILRSNQFYGQLYHRHVSIGFQYLKVIDISHNEFTGAFPAFYFSSWREMASLDDVFFGTYMQDQVDTTVITVSDPYRDSMEMFHKGVYTKFEGIREDLRNIDFSRNKFYGKIPESIGLLKGLRFLNLSRNAFTSNIPKSLANLTNLEVLDLSRNQFFGQIPQNLGILSFLSTMDFSHNNLEGPIPRGTQFESQNCSSFMENPRLYGLEEICGTPHVPNLTPQESEVVTESEEQVINWIAAAIAFGPGVFCGMVIGYIFVSHKHEWFMETFGRIKHWV